jgi:DNA polymerase-3 subunit epsilon
MSQPGFAVIDFETTGLFAGRDRVVEVAVVHVDRHGVITGAWDTLVNPNRDLGPQHIHRIRAADILGAPTFDQIAPQLVELLSGRVIVAHNASFDMRFLVAELERSGYSVDVGDTVLCTMRLAREFIPGAGRSLADCCDAFDIELDGAHRASVDALATARLLEAYILHSPMWNGWSEHIAAAGTSWPPHEIARAEWYPRGSHAADPKTFLERITVKMPDFSGPDDQLDYLALLDRCLLDRQISAHEATALVELAESLGLGRDTCESLHLVYFGQLAAVAWADGQLTLDEIADLVAVATLLSVPSDVVTAAMQKPDATPEAEQTLARAIFALEAGDLVVLTGEMSRTRELWEQVLIERGCVPWAAVTKKVKLLAAADPDSLSGKARKARSYGIPIVGEEALAKLLGQ